jgi:hypothetical protein
MIYVNQVKPKDAIGGERIFYIWIVREYFRILEISEYPHFIAPFAFKIVQFASVIDVSYSSRPTRVNYGPLPITKNGHYYTIFEPIAKGDVLQFLSGGFSRYACIA